MTIFLSWSCPQTLSYLHVLRMCSTKVEEREGKGLGQVLLFDGSWKEYGMGDKNALVTPAAWLPYHRLRCDHGLNWAVVTL